MYTAESAHPVNQEGKRFIECPFYGDCLTHAAKHDWKAWTCAQCPNLRLDMVCKKLKFITPYYQLLSEIYPQFRAKYEPAITLFDLEHWITVVEHFKVSNDRNRFLPFKCSAGGGSDFRSQEGKTQKSKPDHWNFSFCYLEFIITVAVQYLKTARHLCQQSYLLTDPPVQLVGFKSTNLLSYSPKLMLRNATLSYIVK